MGDSSYRLNLRRLILNILMFFMLLALSSCAPKLPVPEAGSGRIGAIFQAVNATSYPLVRAIELQNSRVEEFSIRFTQPPLNGEIAFSPPLVQGTYLIDSYTTKIIPVPGAMDLMRSRLGKFTAPIEVNLEDGEIFLLPVGFTARQYNRAGYVFCDIGWQELDVRSLESYRRQLTAMENASMWKIISK